MSTWTQACKLSMLNQRAQSRQLSMSTRTQACKLSMPNMGTMSSAFNISAFRFTDIAKRNLSRYVQIYNYGIWYGIYYILT